MSTAQRSALLDPQADLFGEAEPPPRAVYTPKPEHVRSGLIEALAALRGAERWPSRPVKLKLQRETVWPYLIRLLPDREEAARWEADLAAEAARLDAAAG